MSCDRKIEIFEINRWETSLCCRKVLTPTPPRLVGRPTIARTGGGDADRFFDDNAQGENTFEKIEFFEIKSKL